MILFCKYVVNIVINAHFEMYLVLYFRYIKVVSHEVRLLYNIEEHQILH